MELGVLALMFAPSYQLISCGSRDRGLLIAFLAFNDFNKLPNMFVVHLIILFNLNFKIAQK